MPSKFTGMIPKHVPKEEVPPPAEVKTPMESPTKRRGRPLKEGAITKNSDFAATSLILNKKAYWQSHARLKREEPNKSMSQLVSDLLVEYGGPIED